LFFKNVFLAGRAEVLKNENSFTVAAIFRTAAIVTMNLGERICVESDVAMLCAVSWKPALQAKLLRSDDIEDKGKDNYADKQGECIMHISGQSIQ
jgi:hypothetical protein